MTKLMPVNPLKIALPLRINMNLYDNKDFTTVISKEGQVVVFDKIENTDVIIHGNEQELKELFLIETNFEAVTFKGKLIMQIMEDYFRVKVVKDKSASQKVISVVTKSTMSIAKWFT